MKILVNYLPQFYETEINNKHFGKGYTEWIAVKGAKSFFEGHNQPRIPLDDNYYSLLDAEVIRWQSKLATAYGIDGFALYHYYFAKNKVELNKPAELLLNNEDIEIDFFFVWANESWGRKKIKGEKNNQWTNLYDTNEGDDVFVEQKYEGEEQYRNHYEYILKFINDKRYIRIDGRPVFAIYNTSNLTSNYEMMSLWTKWSKADGNNGFYFVGINCWEDKHNFDAVVFQAPNAAYKSGVHTKEIRNGVVVKSYRDVMENILSIAEVPNNYFGTFVGFDNSPRYGNTHSLIIQKNNNDYEYYLRRVLKKNLNNNSKCLFINAWNEWGEGNYLEPDITNGYCNLEAVFRAKRGIKCDLSIIIPAYNVELYIKECLNSILYQEKSELSYEIIVIDDGSTDATLNILKQYQREFSEKITLINSEHKGVSEARNMGLDIALGKYIYYVDADDYISSNSLRIFQRVIQGERSFDVCFFSFKNVCSEPDLISKYSNMLFKKKRLNEIEIPINGKEMFNQMWDTCEYYPLVWLQLARREFLEKHRIKFRSDIIYEDQLYSYYVLFYSETVLCFDEEIYYKRIRNDSICTKEKEYDYLYSYLNIYLELTEFLLDKEVSVQDNELIDSFYNRIKKYYLALSEKQRQSYEKCMSDSLKEVLRGIVD